MLGTKRTSCLIKSLILKWVLGTEIADELVHTFWLINEAPVGAVFQDVHLRFWGDLQYEVGM